MAEDEMQWYDYVSILLLVVAGIHVGTVQWFGFDIARFLSFGVYWIEWTIKSLIAVSGVYGLVFLIRKLCGL
jgi:hypothetical protein